MKSLRQVGLSLIGVAVLGVKPLQLSFAVQGHFVGAQHAAELSEQLQEVGSEVEFPVLCVHHQLFKSPPGSRASYELMFHDQRGRGHDTLARQVLDHYNVVDAGQGPHALELSLEGLSRVLSHAGQLGEQGEVSLGEVGSQQRSSEQALRRPRVALPALCQSTSGEVERPQYRVFKEGVATPGRLLPFSQVVPHFLARAPTWVYLQILRTTHPCSSS